MWRIVRIPIMLFIVGTITAGVSIALNPQWLKVESITLTLSANSDEAIIFQRLHSALGPKLTKMQGRYFWEVPLEQVAQIVRADKRVKTVSVYREFPSRIRLEVTPYTAVLAYLGSDNRFYPVARDATLLPPLPLGEFPDLPVLRGKELRDEPELRLLALTLFESLPQEGDLRRASLSEIVYSKKDGFKVFLSQMSGEIKLGETDFGPKISRVKKVLSYLESQDVKSRVIDARFQKKVVVRVRNSP